MIGDRRIVVVVPAFNEEKLIARTVRAIPAFVDQIVVVDDTSTDGTCDEARSVGDPRVAIVRHAQNRGVGAAIATGYRIALADGADRIVVMAADAQMDPADLPALLAPLARDEADYAKGNRLSHPTVKSVMPTIRYIGNRILTVLTRWASGFRGVTDSQCGYTAITRRALATIPLDQIYPRYGYPNDLLGWLRIVDARVVDIPVRPIYGDAVSGIRLHIVIPTLLFILARILLRRVRFAHRSRRLAAQKRLARPAAQT